MTAQPALSPTTAPTVEPRDDALAQRVWNVIVWDDPVTPMPVVVIILRRIFGYPNNKATQLMLKVHHEGRAIVWSGAKERAQGYCAKLQASGLQSTIEQED